MDKNFPGRGVVAVLRTSPETVLRDYRELMHLAGYQEVLSPEYTTALKINISWQHWYPACSTTPWQLEGVIKTMLEDGYPRERLYGCQNDTVVVNAYVGEQENKQRPVLDRYGIPTVYLFEKDVEWVHYEPKGRMLALGGIFPDGLCIPKRFIGENIIQLPTVKTHVFTTTTGAMKNAFGGLLHRRRHWTHAVIHQTLVDLLTIQHEIHPGVLAVMDGTFAGEGPGPRAMVPHVKNVILASADLVAIDAVAARMMGFDPLRLDYIRIAHEMGLGLGDPRQIRIVGDEDAANEDWGFQTGDTFASWGQKQIYHGFLKPLEKFLLRTPLVPWSYMASNLYYNAYWYRFIGRKRVEAMLRTPWGKLFQSY